MQPQSLFTFALLALASATPVQRRACAKPTPVLPLTGAATELPAAPEGMVLKHIALGHGIQNYTCEAAGATAKAIGAVAVLYDATALYPAQGRSSLPTVDQFNALTTNVLWNTPLPLKSDGTEFGADRTTPFPAGAPLQIPGHTLPFLGHHIFDINSVPTFYTGENEVSASSLIKAKLIQKVAAPTTADPGPVGTGAVPWLYLGDAGNSKGLSAVYRVVTAGGTAKACTDTTPQSVPYTTFYWLYGSA